MWEINQMTQTNEEVLRKIKELLVSDKYAGTPIEMLMSQIAMIIPQPEQLEVEIKQTTLGVHVYEAIYYGRVVMKVFETKQEALDWCKKFNLKVTNEPEEE